MKQPSRYLFWGAWGAIVVAALVVIGQLFGITFPEGNVALSNPLSGAVVGFTWGVIVCFLRNLITDHRAR